MPNIKIVTSTVNIPYFLESLTNNINKYNHSDIEIIVIGDENTPDGANDYCNSLMDKSQIEIKYYDINSQKQIFKEYKEFYDFIPLNNNVRKMIGTIYSYLNNTDIVILIDDDNFATEHDFINGHNKVGFINEYECIESDNGWFNICESMIESNRIPFYPRGFPWSKRFVNNSFIEIKKNMKAIVNQGLVLGDPDIDSISRLFWPINVIAIDSHYLPHKALAQGTWTPFNDQNTSISKEIIPLYYKPISGLRNADIWTSFLLNKVAEISGEVITFGEPLVRQLRNTHDLRKDYALEELHNTATEHFIQVINEQNIKSDNHFDVLNNLLNSSLNAIKSHKFDVVTNNDDLRHAHMPNNEESQQRFNDEKKLIDNYLSEYLLWMNLVRKYFL